MTAEQGPDRKYKLKPASRWLLGTLAAGGVVFCAGVLMSEYEGAQRPSELSTILMVGGGAITVAGMAYEATQETRSFLAHREVIRIFDLRQDVQAANERENWIAGGGSELPPQV